MSEKKISDNVIIYDSPSSDSFVGIQNKEGHVFVFLPIGMQISNDESITKKDIRLLLEILYREQRTDSEKSKSQKDKFIIKAFPLNAYLYVIDDFIENGIYREREFTFKRNGTNGKIDWKRTIKNHKPIIQDSSFFYLNTTRKLRTNKNKELISLIHEYCVYESFSKIGFLYPDIQIDKPEIDFDKETFLNVLRSKIDSTNNDRNRLLFSSLISIIEQTENSESEFWFGTYEFEYVWQNMIDKLFGIENKTQYLPSSTWYVNNSSHKNHTIDPDSIMIINGKYYVIDAKYYKFGATNLLKDLPNTSSIVKQLAYAEFIETNCASQQSSETINIFNAFLLPYKSQNPNCPFTNIGYCESDWKSNNKIYEKVKCILVDIKWLMENYCLRSDAKLLSLAKCIEQ